MAVKAIVELKDTRISSSGDFIFYLSILEINPPEFRKEGFVEYFTALPHTSTLAQIQAGISTFVQQWTATNWGTNWTGVDSMRFLAPNITSIAV